MKIRCVDAKPRSGGYASNIALTEDKEYPVEGEVSDGDKALYFITDDRGVKRGYYKDRFAVVKEEEPKEAPPEPEADEKKAPAAPARYNGFVVHRVEEVRYLRCVDPGSNNNVSKDKHYEVVKEEADGFYVIGDNGAQTFVCGWRFENPSERMRIVWCVDPGDPSNHLTPGKGYLVLDEDGFWFKIRDDRGIEVHRKKSRFSEKVTGVTFSRDNGKDERGDIMSDDRNGNPLDTIASSVMHGIKVAAAAQSADLTLEAAKRIFGSDNPVLATEDGRQLAKFAVSCFGIYASSNGVLPFKLPFDPALLQSYFSKVLEASSRDFVQPKLATLSEKAGELMEIFGQMAASAVSAGFAPAQKISVPEPAPAEQKVEAAVEAPVLAAVK